MAQGIQRSDVHAAMQVFAKNYNHDLPDFKKPDSTGSVWTRPLKTVYALFATKVYVSEKDGNVSFVELNWISKIGRRYLGWHKDTAFTDAAARDTLTKVKEHVEGILAASPIFKDIEKSLMPNVLSRGDIKCLHDILVSQKTELNPINSKYIADKILAYETVLGPIEGGLPFSEGFLSAVTELASKHAGIWEKIESTLQADADQNRGALNLALIRGLHGEVPCQVMPISDEIKTAIRTEVEGLMRSDEHLSVLQVGVRRTDYTRLMRMKSEPWQPNGHIIELYLGGEKQEQVKEALEHKFVQKRAYKHAASLYLNDDRMLDVFRLLDHSEMSVYRQSFIQQKINEIEAALLLEIQGCEIRKPESVDPKRLKQWQGMGTLAGALLSQGSGVVGLGARAAGYEGVANAAFKTAGATGNATVAVATFDVPEATKNMAYDRNIGEVLSAWLPNNEMTWRGQIANELANPKYQALIEARIKEGVLPYEVDSQEKYCDWIKRSGNPIGVPELVAISCITDCAVIVVQKVDDVYEIIDRINLDHQGTSFVFCWDGSLHIMSKKAMIPE